MSRAVMDAFAAAWSSRDPQQLASLFTSDCVYEDVNFGAVNHSPRDVREFLSQWLILSSDLSMKMTKRIEAGDSGAAEWVLSGTHDGEMSGVRPTGMGFACRGVSLFEFEEGLIKTCTDYWDMTDVRHALELEDRSHNV